MACRHVRDHPDSKLFSAFPRIHSFSVGLKGSPDLKVTSVRYEGDVARAEIDLTCIVSSP